MVDLSDRGKALEDAFFRKEAEALRQRLQTVLREERDRKALQEASGIRDDALLDHVLSLGIRAETLAALTLIPLVQVAWADRRMDEEERAAVLSGAESTGLSADSPSHGLLRIWLEDEPAPDLYRLWRDVIGAICAELSPEEQSRMRSQIVGRAERVAEATGGFLGLGSKISRSEREVLDSLNGAFPA